MSLVHLRNLTSLTEAGAVVVTAMPAFYQRPQTIDDLISFVAGKVLDVLGLRFAISNAAIPLSTLASCGAGVSIIVGRFMSVHV